MHYILILYSKRSGAGGVFMEKLLQTLLRLEPGSIVADIPKMVNLYIFMTPTSHANFKFLAQTVSKKNAIMWCMN